MREPCDRSEEVKEPGGKLEIRRNDFCDAYKMDEDRMFLSRECWYCKYGDFGIFTENPTEIGIYNYQENMRQC